MNNNEKKYELTNLTKKYKKTFYKNLKMYIYDVDSKNNENFHFSNQILIYSFTLLSPPK